MATTRSNAVRKETVVRNINAVSARYFGSRIGKGDATHQSDADALHRQYDKSNDAAKRAIRSDFMVGYIAGRLGMNEAQATSVHKAKRDECSKEEAKAKMAASQQFLYLIARTGSKAKGKSRAGAGKYNVRVTVTPEVRKLADKLFACFSAKDIDEQFRKVKAALDKIVREEKDAAKAAANEE